jgi:seryl-tRNA synthetase
LTISIPQKMKEKIEQIDKLMLLLIEMRKQIQELQDKQAAEEKLYTWSIDFISHKEYEEYLVKHNNISDQINMLLKTYALISNEMSKVCLNLI